MAPAHGSGGYTTAEGLEEKSKLQRHFRRIDMLLFTVCALVGLDTLGQVSGYGASTFSWLVLLAIFFLFPYALIMAELGTTFAQEGGPYEWMKLAWGRAWGGVGSVLYWVTNPLWVGGSLAFMSTDAWSSNIHPIGSGSVRRLRLQVVFIWISIIVAIVSLRRGKWIPNFGALVRIGVLAFFSMTVVIYAIEHGVHGYAVGNFNPFQLTAFLGLVPLLLFNYVGFELQNGAAEEMVEPAEGRPGHRHPGRRRSRRSPTASRSSGSSRCCRPRRSPASGASSTRCTRRSACTAAPATSSST